MIKVLLIISGTLSLFLGILGVVVPGLPATPFFLLTAACYVKSSDRLYRFVINHRIFGKFIQRYRLRKGLTLKNRISSILFMWMMIFISVYFFIDNKTVEWIVGGAGIVGTVVVGFILPKARVDGEQTQ